MSQSADPYITSWSLMLLIRPPACGAAEIRLAHKQSTAGMLEPSSRQALHIESEQRQLQAACHWADPLQVRQGPAAMECLPGTPHVHSTAGQLTPRPPQHQSTERPGRRRMCWCWAAGRQQSPGRSLALSSSAAGSPGRQSSVAPAGQGQPSSGGATTTGTPRALGKLG